MTTEETSQENRQSPSITNGMIGIRFLYTILFFFAMGVVGVILKIAILFQFVILFATRKHNEPVRDFCNQLSTYGYRLLRYITLNENRRPFPFSDYPGAMEPPEKQVLFDRW